MKDTTKWETENFKLEFFKGMEQEKFFIEVWAKDKHNDPVWIFNESFSSRLQQTLSWSKPRTQYNEDSPIDWYIIKHFDTAVKVQEFVESIKQHIYKLEGKVEHMQKELEEIKL